MSQDAREPQNLSELESQVGNILAGGRNPIFAFVFDNCKTHYLSHRQLFTANITLCGYDYYALAENEMDAKLDLCNMLMKSRYIQQNFKK